MPFLLNLIQTSFWSPNYMHPTISNNHPQLSWNVAQEEQYIT